MDNGETLNNQHVTTPNYRARLGVVASIIIIVSNVLAVVFNFAQYDFYGTYSSYGTLFFMVSKLLLDIILLSSHHKQLERMYFRAYSYLSAKC